MNVYYRNKQKISKLTNYGKELERKKVIIKRAAGTSLVLKSEYPEALLDCMHVIGVSSISRHV